MTRKDLSYALIVGQVFLWTGSAFLSVLCRLLEFYAPVQVTLLTEALYYAAQALGMGAFALLLRCKPALAGGGRFAAFALAATLGFTLSALYLNNGVLVALAGLAMNVCIGLLSGAYLTRLTSRIPSASRGRVFAIAYAVGSVGTWLISIPFGGALLQGAWSPLVFLVLAAASIYQTRRLAPIVCEAGAGEREAAAIDGRLIALALSIPFLCSVINGLGNYFSAADISTVCGPAFTRVFYAVGLVIAGIVSDRDRRFGAVCCIVALIFPFVALALRHEVGASVVMSAFGYIFYGFFAVYRVVLFADVAAGSERLLPLAVFGLLAGRVGDALGTLGGVYLEEEQTALTITSAGAFILCALLFFALYNRLYMTPPSEHGDIEALLNGYEARFGFIPQQCRIFRLVVEGL